MLFSSIINTTSSKAKLQQYAEPPVCWSEPDPYVVTWAYYLFTCLLINSFTCCSCHKGRWTAYASFIPESKKCIVGKLLIPFCHDMKETYFWYFVVMLFLFSCRDSLDLVILPAFDALCAFVSAILMFDGIRLRVCAYFWECQYLNSLISGVCSFSFLSFLFFAKDPLKKSLCPFHPSQHAANEFEQQAFSNLNLYCHFWGCTSVV